MTSPEKPGFEPTSEPTFSERKRRRKEIPQFNVLERICHGVEVVELTSGDRKYHVIWGEKTLGVPHECFFGTVEQVLHQHERVVERYLGTEILSASRVLVALPGEVQRMNELSGRLTILSSRYQNPLVRQRLPYFREEISSIEGDLRRVTNQYKRRAQRELESTFLTADKGKQATAVLEANLAILTRTQECLGIVKGTSARYETIVNKRNGWEDLIAGISRNLAAGLERLDQGRITGFGFIASSRYSGFAQLQRITDPEYHHRIQRREVQNLATFDEALEQGNIRKARRILENAISVLNRVVLERETRKRNE